jgi:hypothetical protein
VAPLRGFDGGQHAYIQTAARLAVSKTPTLLVQSRDGKSALVDHHVRLPHDIVDWLDADVLIVGVGRQHDRVTILRTAAGHGRPAGRPGAARADLGYRRCACWWCGSIIACSPSSAGRSSS